MNLAFYIAESYPETLSVALIGDYAMQSISMPQRGMEPDAPMCTNIEGAHLQPA